MSVDKNTAEPTVEQIQEVQEETSNPEKTATPETTVETTEKPLSEILQVQEEKESDSPDFKHLYKNERKEKRQLQARIKELEKRVEDGDIDDEQGISDSIDELADEFNVDKTFLKKLKKSLKEELGQEVNSKLKPLQEKEKAERFNNAFNVYFEAALEKTPEFKGVVNKEAIKALAALPQNAHKTLSQLMEETYGNALGGKRTIETTTPRGGAEPTEVDVDRATKDPSYFKEIMANPDLKKKYNEGLAQRALR